ncbi:MAG: zinc metallopeptidase [Acidobacteriota bacterium]|nr:zinc metallopeptidase [Acidobacteriota bacterium]
MLRGRESSNIEDRRGMGGKGIAVGGGGIGVLLLSLVIYLCGGNEALNFFNQITGGDSPQVSQQPQQQQAPNNQRANDDQRSFAASVLGSTEDVWNQVLQQQARTRYREPKLVLFDDRVQSACGVAGSSTGPFYCPGDEKLYLDFSFFRDLKTEFKADGDFAQAYVIAHEVGHHVQNILGTMDKVNSAGENNQLSVALELQADCYAGVWANYAQKKGLVEAGDAEEAIRAAAAVGDDAIQKRAQGYVVPESFTHGSSKERMSWFTRGFQTGDMRQCNTFGR